MSTKQPDVRDSVKDHYKSIAVAGKAQGCSPASSCCGGDDLSGEQMAVLASGKMGYTAEELNTVPEGSNLGLGCGNPQAIADLKPGEHVIDLGSGGGFDCFLAARQVGAEGAVIGVDMTDEMLQRATENAGKAGFGNVEFRKGMIEDIPVEENWADVLMSNCVINLSPDKEAVYREAYRVLKPAGRLAISDTVALQELPETITQDPELYAGCAAGAITETHMKTLLEKSGFQNIHITLHPESAEYIKTWGKDSQLAEYIQSASITATKPKACC